MLRRTHEVINLNKQSCLACNDNDILKIYWGLPIYAQCNATLKNNEGFCSIKCYREHFGIEE